MIGIGPLTIFYWLAGIVMTGALVFLGIVPWSDLEVAFWLFFVVPVLFTIAFSRLHFVRESVFQMNTFLATAGSLMLLIANVYFLGILFDYHPAYSLIPPQSASLLVSVLYAIYEESLMLCIVVVFAAVGNAWLGIIFADLVFFGLHALRYPNTAYFDLFLLVGRSVMSGALVATGNSDVPYTTHIVFNILAGG